MATSPQESSLKKGPWTPEEDRKLIDCIHTHGHGSWKELPKLAGLNRCGKSCRLRWTNYLRPDIKRGAFSDDEESLIIDLHAKLGNKWSAIASYLPGRTDNEIKNFWNTHLKKKLLQNGIDPVTHMPSIHLTSQFLSSSGLRNLTWENVARFQTDAARVAKVLLIGNILQLLNPGTSPRLPMESFNHSSESPHLNSRSPFDSINLQLEGLAPKPEHNTLTCQQGYDSIHQPMFQNEIETNIFIGGKSNEFGEPVPMCMYTDYTVPDLVSSSPGRLSNDEVHNNIISPEIFSNLSSTSKTFEDLGDLMDNEASNYYWEQILNQGSISP